MNSCVDLCITVLAFPMVTILWGGIFVVALWQKLIKNAEKHFKYNADNAKEKLYGAN